MKHDVLKHSSFFQHMEEFGYMRDITELLPEDFTAVFEIARVLEDPNAPLFKAIEPAMTVAPQAAVEKRLNDREWQPNRNVSHGEEYEAALMQSYTDLKRIFPHQYLLPEEVFMERYARRSLWINIPRSPMIVPFGNSSSEYSPNNFKQKVYLLLDTSTSMASHHRFQMAKAVAYVFLKRNLKELGHIYLRTFDTDLGPLQTAIDAPSLQNLLHYVMRLTKLGNGTVLERAILQAAADIRISAALSGAEMLIVTDGAAHLDVDKIREALGGGIRINTIKIGDAVLYPDEKLLSDLASRGATPRQRDLKKLEEEIGTMQRQLTSAGFEREKGRLKSHLQTLTQRAATLRGEIVEGLRQWYGREIEQLSRVFVNINDISADSLFVLQQSEIDEIRQLLAEVEQDFSEGMDADSLREAALLYEHVQMLLKSATDNAQRAQLQALAQRLNELLHDVVKGGEHKHAGLRNITRDDIHDLQMILHMQSKQGGSLADLLLLMLRQILKRFFSPKQKFRFGKKT